MKVLNLRCANAHVFEGWFGSEDDYQSQNERAAIECPMCGDHAITRMLSAPRLNLGAARPSETTPAAVSAAGSSLATREDSRSKPGPGAADVGPSVDMQAAWLRAVRDVIVRTEDVGARFAEEARRMHYGEIPNRGIRGQASPDEREALLDEGIETLSLPMPQAFKGSVQ